MNNIGFLKSKGLYEWISQKYLDMDHLLKLARRYSYQKPFRHLLLPGFLKKRKIVSLRSTLLESGFYNSHTDRPMGRFLSTYDFDSYKKRSIKKFYEFISSTEFREYCSLLTSLDLSDCETLMNAKLFTRGHYITRHDDNNGNRKLNLVLSLCSMNKKYGGSLVLYKKIKNKVRVSRVIQPQYNQLTLMEVSQKSVHEVKEVQVNKKRLTISGWFVKQLA
jgi:Rps23 Pro-64 3,4-dihydroxylase Tpa1-like proline 4-hydroxylase